MKDLYMINNIIIRLAIYYLSWLLFLGGIFHLFPQILYHVDQEQKRGAISKSIDFEISASPTRGSIQEGLARLIDPAHTIPVLVALILAFAVTLPITWVYRWTRTRKKYSQAFAHTLLMVPIAIALVVFLVKGSLALAFSLAGIVAAVRFRTSLDEPQDAVYMFMAIGIGLAAGIQLTTVAYISSLIFVIVALGVWKSDYGAQPALISGWSIVRPEEKPKLRPEEKPELRPEEKPKLRPEEKSKVRPDKNPQVPDSNKKATPSAKPYNAQLLVRATEIETAEQTIVPVLKNRTKRWKAAEPTQNEDGTVSIAFDLWLKKSVDPSSFAQEIEKSGHPHLDKIELKTREIGSA